MKTMRFVLIGLAVLVLGTAPAFAQRTLTNTTLAANLSATATQATLTSVTGVTVGQFGYLDRELVQITAVDTTNAIITIQRGQGGTQAAAHDNAERIFIANGGDYKTIDPDYGQDCNRGVAQAAVLPWINTRTGNIWNCPLGTDRAWNGTNTMGLTYNSTQTGSP